MSLSSKPDATEIHRLLSIGAVKDDYRVTLTDITFLKTTENDHHILKAKTSGQDVVVKFTYEDGIPRLEDEARIYVKYLKPFWGVHVPKFYGFYLYESGDSSDLDELSISCACIVLQYCGEPAVAELSQLKDYRCDEYGVKRFRNDAIDVVLRLHSPEIGLSHNALDAPNHILDFEGKPFLIDFAISESRECPAWINVERLTREVLPVKEDEIGEPFGSPSMRCYELWSFLKSTEYWIPYEIEFQRRLYCCESITSASDFYEQALFKWPRFLSEQELWDESVKQWKRIRANWKIYHPDAVHEPPLGVVDLEEYQKAHPSRSHWW